MGSSGAYYVYKIFSRVPYKKSILYYKYSVNLYKSIYRNLHPSECDNFFTRTILPGNVSRNALSNFYYSNLADDKLHF